MPYRTRKCFSVCLLVLLSLQSPVMAQDVSSGALAASIDSGDLRIISENGRYQLVLAAADLGRDFIVLSRVVEPGNRIPKYDLTETGLPGSKLVENNIRFELLNDDSVGINLINAEPYYQSLGLQGKGLSGSKKCNTVFPLIRRIRDVRGEWYVLDVTDLLVYENDILHINAFRKRNLLLDPGISVPVVIKAVKTGLNSIEIVSSLDYGPGKTLLLSTNLYRLPVPQMPIRRADPRVGYYVQSVSGQAGVNGSLKIDAILRWNIRPKQEDLPKYFKGELVEPEKPIVYYIDSSVPEKWVPYYIKGVGAWQRAFETVGFKNAIYALRLPIGDTTFSKFSIHSSIIHYVKSRSIDATYSMVVDHRSGEILQSQIVVSSGMETNQGARYVIQASPSDKRVRNAIVPDSIMGELIQRVVSHEVGHALGFPHNFESSYSVPVERLRQRQWLDSNGISASIMDYSRYNYVAQPEDSLTSISSLIKDIGKYDFWALDWGYRVFQGNCNKVDSLLKLRLMQSRRSRELKCGGEGHDNDPRSQAEDLGDNALQASTYGMKNLRFVLENLNRLQKDGRLDSSRYAELFKQLRNHFEYYLLHLASTVVGVKMEYGKSIEPIKIWRPITKRVREKALQFLDEHLFNPKEFWLEQDQNPGIRDSISLMMNERYYNLILSRLFDYGSLSAFRSSPVSTVKAFYSIQELIRWCNRMILDRAVAYDQSVTRSMLLRMYVSKLLMLISPLHIQPADWDIPFREGVIHEVKEIRTWLLLQMQKGSYVEHKPEAELLIKEIDSVLNGK